MRSIACGARSVLPLSDGYGDLNLRRAFPDVPEAVWQTPPDGVVGENPRCWLTSYLCDGGEGAVVTGDAAHHPIQRNTPSGVRPSMRIESDRP